MTKKENDTNGEDKQEYDLSNFRVLIVEDFQFVANLLTTSLHEFGIGSVLQSSSGNQGIEKIKQYNATETSANIDVIILDWLMPDGNGIEFLKWLRGHQRDSICFVPVIVCSAYTSETVVTQSRDLGANEVIVKPVSASKLAQRIKHVIEKPRPFIKAPSFFGPDRRRQDKPFDGPEKREKTEDAIEEHHEQL